MYEGIVDETCTVELVNSVVEGNSATITFRGVGSAITGYTCKLDGDNLPECMFLKSLCMYSSVNSHGVIAYQCFFLSRFQYLLQLYCSLLLYLCPFISPVYLSFPFVFLLTPTEQLIRF